MKRIERSASITLDTGTTRACLDHNVRKTIAEHVDTARSYMNKILVNIDLREAYERLFKDAIDKYLSRNKKKAPLDRLDSMKAKKPKAFMKRLGSCLVEFSVDVIMLTDGQIMHDPEYDFDYDLRLFEKSLD
jgi:hypothetical protein